MANLLKKKNSDRIFYVTIADTDIKSLTSLHTLFDKYLDHMLVKFEQIVWSELHKIWKWFMINHFWQSVDAILKDVSVNETIVWYQTSNLETITFQCSKFYGSPIHVTRLKIEPNMADPISLNEKRP